MNRLFKLFWFIYALFLISCARQSSPTGGPKDTIPPVLIKAIPGNEAINFKGKSIELTFSELVALANAKEQIIIAPTVGKDFEVDVRNNRVVLNFEKDLQDSTTYTFNFRDAVQDVTEKNPVRNLKLAISTGTYIDSMSVEGTVFNILQQKELKDVTVAIQAYNDTFNILKHPATFFTKSDEKGNFKIENLKPGLYNLYAFQDQNKNLIVDSRSEAYGFLKDSVLLDDNIKKIEIGLVRLDTRPLKITSARPYNTYFNIKTSKNVKAVTITAADSSDIYYSFGADNANLQIYNTLVDKDSTLINVSLEDSIQNRIDTTLYGKFLKREIDPEKFDYKIDETSLLADKGIFKAIITFTKPLKEVDFDSIRFTIDSTKILSFTQEDLFYDEPRKILTLTKKFDKNFYAVEEEGTEKPNVSNKTIADTTKSKTNQKPGIKNEFYLGYAAFISVEQDSSKQSKQSITPARTEDLGMIIAELEQTKSNIIIQLIDKEQKIIAAARNKSPVSFEDLNPGEYLLRIILDRNGNGVWDPGNYLRKEEPEEIYYYENETQQREIKLKANFELGPLLITY
jgi:uncharacterized protein (DUF2141 family)